MAPCNVHLLDLPNEILFFILKKLENIDVLYSLLGINHQRLESIAQDKTFTTKLNLILMSSNDNICTVSNRILNRYYSNIFPKISYNIKYLILDSSSIEQILFAGNYPNLNNIKLYNFNKKILSTYFQGKKIFIIHNLFKDN